MSERVLVVNPGGGSTRVALFAGERRLHAAEIRHTQAENAAAASVDQQLELRIEAIYRQVESWGFALEGVAAAVGRGGPYRPLPGGVYEVGSELLEDVRAGRLMADHPSKLGAELAWRLAQPAGAPAFVVDPVCVDELSPVARLTGLPELPRVSLFHALNIRAVARRHAASQCLPLEELCLIVAHLGSGTSVALLRGGRAVDVNNSADEGPFSARRAGGLPATGLLELACQPGFDLAATKRRLMAGGGMLAHLGTADLEEAESRAAAGDEHAELVLEAMAYGVAKAVGGLAGACAGAVDAILLTGGMAHSEPWLARIEERVRWIAPIHRFPGEGEMLALAEGALGALRGTVPVRAYPSGRPHSG